MLHLEKRPSLPEALDDIDYRITKAHGDFTGHLVIHIESERSKFRGERVLGISNFLRRKIENLFVIAMPYEKLHFSFD